ncbi:histidine acid phosphatase [Cooperia oncophora]
MTPPGISLLFYLLAITAAQNPSSTLQFVEFWFRHGERTPTHYMYFPNETPSVPYTEAEAGELTNRGVQQAYQRGKFIRQRYDTFLGKVYRPSEIHVWTGKDNRTVVTAEAVLAAVYPPDRAHRWSPELNWQPVAVHTDQTIDWVSTGIDHVCTEYEKALFDTPQYRKILDPFRPNLTEFLESNTGVNIATPEDFNNVIDALVTKLALNDARLPYPKWAEHIRKNVSSFRAIFHQRMIDAQSDTAGRYHSEMLLSFIEDHLNRPQIARNKAVFVSGHDTNFMTLGRQLDVSPLANETVPFAALLAVELHFINGTYFVELWLSPSLDDELFRVNIPQCTHPCKLETLKGILQGRRLTRDAWEVQCRGFGVHTGYDGIVTASMILLLAIFVISTVILACTTYSYRKQVKELQDPERRRLLEES